MKLDPQQPVAKASKRPEADAQQPAKKRKSAPFAQVLARKKSESEEKVDSQPGGKTPAITPSPFAGVEKTAGKSGPSSTTGPVVANLVSEIVVIANTAERQEVSVEVDSKVLGGLTIHLTRAAGESFVAGRSVSRLPRGTALTGIAWLVSAFVSYDVRRSNRASKQGGNPPTPPGPRSRRRRKTSAVR